MSLTIDGLALSPTPGTFTITPFRIERRDRVADGTMVVDVIAIKHSYKIGYYQLDGSEIDYWLDLYDAGNTLAFTYPVNGVTQSKTVWITGIDKEMVYESPEVWQGVTITLEEI